MAHPSFIMARASKQNPLPNAPLELSDPIALPAGALPGADLLRELAPGHAALLFDVLRVATAWAADGGASGWYDAAMLRGWEEAVLTASLDEHLRSAVAVLLGELVDPAAADPGRLSMCCLQISEWALDQGAESTSLTFCQAAALVQPTNARLAYVAGRRYRTACRFRDADLWLRRSARIALWYSDWDTYARALNSLGNLAYRQGNFPRARVYLARALRVAQRHGLRTLEGEIYHDRFALALVSRDDEDLEALARAAYERYLPAHERLYSLAYDISYYWLVSGYAERALHVLEALLVRFAEPEQRFQVLAASARAAGALGNRSVFDEMWETGRVLSTTRNHATLAAALIDFGYGAGHLEDWIFAEAAFQRAEEVAEMNGQGEERLLAGRALTAVRRRENPDPIMVRRVSSSTEFSRHLALHLATNES